MTVSQQNVLLQEQEVDFTESPEPGQGKIQPVKQGALRSWHPTGY